MIMNRFHPNSGMAWYIENYIRMRQKEGFKFYNAAKKLLEFDMYCFDYNINPKNLNNESLMKEWNAIRPGESIANHQNRTSIVKSFFDYLKVLGLKINVSFPARKKVYYSPAYELSDAEVAAFFKSLDAYDYSGLRTRNSYYRRMTYEYKVIFRLIYSCGLRNNEACTLKICDIDFSMDRIMIRGSKGDKDRAVYMDKKMSNLLSKYLLHLKKDCSEEIIWAFPAKNEKNPMLNTRLDIKFKEIWKLTPFYEEGLKSPTVHSLRHKFVTKRINLWIAEGRDLDTQMPYLEKYLGHANPYETLYYYHMDSEAHDLIRRKDSHIKRVLIEGGEK